MGKKNKRQASQYAASQAARASQAQRSHQDTESSDDENTPPANMQLLSDRSGGKAKTLRVQLVEKDARILELEAVIAALKLDVSRLQDQNLLLTSDNSTLLQENTNILLDNMSLNSLKRKADSTHTEELRGRNKRIKRMERERAVKKDTNAEVFEALKDSLDASGARIAELESQLSAHISSHNSTVRELRSTLRDKQSTLTATRNTLYASQKQCDRAKTSLKETRTAYDALRTWRPTQGGQYTSAARELARNLIQAGCAAGKVEFAVMSCARTFGVAIEQGFMSARTVSHALDEGGKYGELQLAREIMDAPGSYSAIPFHVRL
jgi:chromosome segregation ATPase